MKAKPVLSLIAVLLFSVLTSPAAAVAVPAGEPIRCGMVVQEDAQLHLASDVHCAASGVRIEQGPNTIRTIQIDLRGHPPLPGGSGRDR